MDQAFAILDSFIDSMSIIDLKGEIIFTNKAWKKFSIENSGNFNETDCGINYLDLCKKVTGQELQNAIEAKKGIEKVIKRKSPIFELEYPCHSADEQRWFIMRACPLLPDNGLTMISHINVTKRKLAEEKVEKRNKQLKIINDRLDTTMLKIVHDIQGPLNSIEGLLDLTRYEGQNQTISPYFSLIEKSVSNLKGFIQDTLNLSVSKSTPLIELVDFRAILNVFFESIKYDELLKNIKIETNINQHVDFYSDKNEIASILSNLISNSLKYYDKKKSEPCIIITIEVNKIEASMSIKDNGIGISNDMISHIFDLNFQMKKGTSSGSGVGLYLVRKSISFINGKIHVNSTLGVGTETFITIPNLDQSKK